MNLAHDPWIPVTLKDGTPGAPLSLIGVFERAGDVADLAVRPHEKVALLRLLTCISQAASSDALDLEAAAAYLRQWAPRFALFGPGPRFLQLKTAKTEVTETSRLWFQLASGNNHTVYDHAGGSPRRFAPGELALALVTFQNFTPLGGRGYKGRGPAIDANMVHVYRWGGSLEEVLRLNFAPAEDAEVFYHEDGIGRPVWELCPDQLAAGAPAAIRTATGTWLGRLAPMTRAIWLDEGGATMSLDNGLLYPAFEQFREPSSVVWLFKTKTASTRRLLSARLDQDLWRSLPAFTARRLSDGSPGAPLALHVRHDGTEDCPIWCAALVSDFQAKIIDALEAFFVLPAGLFEEGGRQAYERGVGFAEIFEKRLHEAVGQYATLAQCPSPRLAAVRHYWNAVTQAHRILLNLSRRGEPPDGTNPWHTAVRSAAYRAFERACPTETAKQLLAFAEAQKKLWTKPKQEKAKATKPKKPTHAHD
jgi:CRISPR system Cascade subunit CasA